MEDFIFVTIVIVLGVLPLLIVRRFVPEALKNLALASWGAHIFSALAQILLYMYFYTGGDALAYGYHAVPIVAMLKSQGDLVLPEVGKLFLHMEHNLPAGALGSESSGSMLAVTIVLFLFLGNSLFAASVTIAIASFVAKFLTFRALQQFVSTAQHRNLFVAVMLVPSFVFWTSTVLKEPAMWLGLGPSFWALSRIVLGKNVIRNAVILAVTLLWVGLLKSYVMVSFIIAGAVWLTWSRLRRSGGTLGATPVTIAAAVGMIVIAVSVAPLLFPRLKAGQLSEAAAGQRRVMERGGSGYDLGVDEGEDGDSAAPLTRRVLMAPVALFTGLYRPLIFEARNPVQFLNALETTALLLVSIQVLRRNRLAELRRRLTRRPLLLFCLTFSLILSFGTTLATSNLGTLSRYRAPMTPFFVVLLLLLRDDTREEDEMQEVLQSAAVVAS